MGTSLCRALMFSCLLGVAGCDCDIKTDGLPDGTVNQAYSTTLEPGTWCADGIWSLSSGTLPPGISLFNDGRLSGTPIAAGSFTLTVMFTEGDFVGGGGGSTKDRSYTIVIR